MDPERAGRRRPAHDVAWRSNRGGSPSGDRHKCGRPYWSARECRNRRGHRRWRGHRSRLGRRPGRSGHGRRRVRAGGDRDGHNRHDGPFPAGQPRVRTAPRSGSRCARRHALRRAHEPGRRRPEHECDGGPARPADPDRLLRQAVPPCGRLVGLGRAERPIPHRTRRQRYRLPDPGRRHHRAKAGAGCARGRAATPRQGDRAAVSSSERQRGPAGLRCGADIGVGAVAAVRTGDLADRRRVRVSRCRSAPPRSPFPAPPP